MRRLTRYAHLFWFSAIALTGLALLPGCAVLRAPAATQMSYFTLDGVDTGAPAGRKSRLTLEVSPARGRPGFDSARMVYVKRANELDSFAKNRWVDTPAHMLTPLLLQALGRSGRFRAVIAGPNTIAADLRLDSEVMRLQQEFLHQPSRVRLTVRAQLIDLAGGRVLGSREFDISEPAPSGDPYGGVIAANRAVRSLLKQMVAFCAARAAALGATERTSP